MYVCIPIIYLCMCTYTCIVIYMLTSIHLSIHPSIHPSMHARMHACIHTYMYMNIQACTNINNTYIYINTHAYTYIYTYIHTYIHVYIYIYMYADTHINTYLSMFKGVFYFTVLLGAAVSATVFRTAPAHSSRPRALAGGVVWQKSFRSEDPGLV